MGGVLVTQASLANQAVEVTCQSEAVQGSSGTAFRLGFAEALEAVVARAVVKLLLQGDDELRALASWGTTTW